MDEVDRSVFKIPFLERHQAVDFAVSERMAGKAEIVAERKVEGVNLYEELTAISEEILECRSRILETY